MCKSKQMLRKFVGMLYVCMYVCMYVCTYVCMYAHFGTIHMGVYALT